MGKTLTKKVIVGMVNKSESRRTQGKVTWFRRRGREITDDEVTRKAKKLVLADFERFAASSALVGGSIYS